MKRIGAEKKKCDMVFSTEIISDSIPVPPSNRVIFSADVVREDDTFPKEGNVKFITEIIDDEAVSNRN